jgi:ubiquinone/menaquinone biosynthesis C-methylase UbiE
MLQNKILKAYEDLSEHYNALIDTKPHNAFYDRPNTLSLFPEKIEGLKILDAACGPGKYAEILTGRGAALKGFDLSPKMVSFAQKRNNNSKDFFAHDLTQPLHMFSNESFHIVLCALALDYIEDWNFTIQEFNRVLQVNGTLIISISHPFFDYTYFNSEDIEGHYPGFFLN